MVTTVVTYSEISDFLACRWRWEKTWLEKYESSSQVNEPMSLGDAVHYGISEWLLDGIDPENSLAAWMERIEKTLPTEIDMYDAARDIMESIAIRADPLIRRALDFFDVPNKWTTVVHSDIPLVEAQIALPLGRIAGEQVEFQSHIDWVAESAQGGAWVLDHKIRHSLGKEDAEQTRLQTAIYQYVLLKGVGLETVGSATIQMLDKMPSIPKINKDGSVSRQAVATTWDIYRQAVVAAGGNPADYLDMYAKLKDNEFIRVVRAYRNKTELENTWKRVVMPTIQMMLDSPRITRSLGSLYCSGCKFRDPCLADLRGGDAEYLLRTMYKQRRVEEEEEELVATE